MKLARTIAEARAAVAAARKAGSVIGLVPTMGYLHEGHLSLIDLARSEGADFVAVSIFVNPTQFGPLEDFGKYPRDEAGDAAKLEGRGVDLVFAPSTSEMYPSGSTTRVVPGQVAAPLEGERRPGHFDGVATVVLKLFNIIVPDLAVFGRKDAQQCAVIDRMVRDLDVPVRLALGETVRESDGLAMSSRNAYLDARGRSLAPALARSLEAGRNALDEGRTAESVERAMAEELRRFEGVELDYLRVVDPSTFLPPRDLERDLLLVGAVRIGRTRLIDNLPIPHGARSTGAQSAPILSQVTRSNTE